MRPYHNKIGADNLLAFQERFYFKKKVPWRQDEYDEYTFITEYVMYFYDPRGVAQNKIYFTLLYFIVCKNNEFLYFTKCFIKRYLGFVNSNLPPAGLHIVFGSDKLRVFTKAIQSYYLLISTKGIQH